jgi:RNA polymerase sigma-70 factor, ECF subfamily
VSTAVEVAVAAAHRRGWARVLATVVRLTRDLDVAEDAVADAFTAALEAWAEGGVPAEPIAWLTTVARRRALDVLRSDQTRAQRLPLLVVPAAGDEPPEATGGLSDARLRLVFTCCHPALALEARVALTLRLVCGLAVAEIARMFLVPEATLAARVTRAKKKIRAAGIPYRVPPPAALAERLPAVLAVVYLVYTDGHTAARGPSLTNPGHAQQALELARLLAELLPDEPEVSGLLALLLLSEARRSARVDTSGRLVPLEEQDRRRWDPAAIAEGLSLVERALRPPPPARPGPYAIQAAIAAVHAEAPNHAATDWPQILALYDALLAVQPSPVAALGRAVALGLVAGPAAALAEVDRLAADPRLAGYHLLPATRADLLARMGLPIEAAATFRAAAALTDNLAERDHLRRRAEALDPEKEPG